MTFSIVARDASGAIGSAVCSSSPAVAARCLHLEGGVGAVNSQNITDPRLGPAILDVLRNGRGAEAALRSVVETADHIAFRQLLVVDATGNSVAYSGTEALGVHGDACGPGVAAGGNMLASLDIPQIMVDAFLASEGELEARLLSAMHAAVEAGGEAGPVHSAGLSVVRDAGWRVTDLRVDWTDGAPIGELDSLLVTWMPQRDDYVNRGLNPGVAPSYGVPGDE
ncbi:DUF1028 domain-containing protein [Pseudoclavibacter sp. RFBB5]|uniref:DUF1028 domain-containing protein n=1 Tax=Pseudoclavibacter sp. RFBB5 TaxID=2080574 RepID=UPI000CE854E2|nr:DUF1028 domain-containing protein [Pseudoclavibacter sp. RFBB5]PPG27154.1 DUF1028 domain-containing protein [Pseudoclavibacter sp. RFBB5]